MKRLRPVRESLAVGRPHRERMLAEMEALVKRERATADRRRREYFRPAGGTPAAYARSLGKYRRDFYALLGWPLSPAPESPARPTARRELVGEDELGKVYRLWIRTLPGLETYGLYFVPSAAGPHPLMLCQHGGLGTPELVGGLLGGTANYNDMVLRVRRRGFAVFAPQLQLWSENYGPANQRQNFDAHLKQLGGSITALEIYRLRRSLDYLCERPEIEAKRVGMVGLSYGGHFTLFTTAADPRIKAALSSCFFNDRYAYNWADWTWKGAAQKFLDPEVVGLICPRPLWIEVGVKDELFNVAGARRQAGRVRTYYRAAGVPKHFTFRAFAGGHELDRDEAGLDFLCQHVRAAK